MSKKTHRWQSKYRKHLNIPSLGDERKSISEQCLVSVNLENSSYFTGSKLPRAFIFHDIGIVKRYRNNKKVTKASAIKNFEEDEFDYAKTERKKVFQTTETVAFDKIPPSILGTDNSWSKSPFKVSSQSLKVSSNATDGDSEVELKRFRRLDEEEYVEGVCIENLLLLRSPEVRCYLLSTIPEHFSEMHSVLEEIKNSLSNDSWQSFQLIVIGDEFDLTKDVLKKTKCKDSDGHKGEDLPVPSGDISYSLKKLAISVDWTIKKALKTSKEILSQADNIFNIIEDNDSL